MIFYTTHSKENEINKTLQSPVEVNANINVSELDVMRPQFLIKKTDISGNYIYISKLNRYYFIDTKTTVDNVHTYLTLRCDVLMSWKDVIMNATGHIVKSQNGNSYYGGVESECRTASKRYVYTNGQNIFSDSGMLVLVTSEG